MSDSGVMHAKPSTTRKLVIQTVSGALAGGVSMFGLLWVVDHRGFDVDRIDHVLTLGAGLVMALMAIFVALGASMPRLGAKVLNVEDEAEVRYERRDMLLSALCMLLIAAGLLALALYSSGSETVIGRDVAAGIVAFAIIASTLISLFAKLRQDELNKLVVKEATAFTGNGMLILFGGWATLAHFGYTTLFTPLTFIGGSVAIFLLGLFVVLGLRGMLQPR